MIKNRTTQDKVVHFTIWDNLARHEKELIAIGATDADLRPLRAAAEAVDKAEKEAAAGDLPDDCPGELMSPLTTVLGFDVLPPTNAARYWASMAVAKVAGVNQDGGLGSFHAVVCGLYILRYWGEDRKDEVMRAVHSPGAFAELIPTWCAGINADAESQLVEQYLKLMGIRLADVKKKQAMETYDALYTSLRRMLEKLLPNACGGAPGTAPSSGDGLPGGTGSQPL